MADYIHDVFISYRHESPVRDWVLAHFYELLKGWLPQYMPVDHKPEIFIDADIETGTEWPAMLRRELQRSRCLLTIWSPVYFQSEWCLAEFHSFREREKQLGLRTDEKPYGLIYAVLFANARDLPAEVRAIRYKDMSDWAISSPAFKESKYYIEFEMEMKKLCQELAGMIRQAPAWEDNWPVVTPSSTPTSSFALPRL